MGYGSPQEINILKNIVPTFVTFDTNPSLDGATTGTKTIGSGTTIGEIKFDLGFIPTNPIMILPVFSMWTSTGSITALIDTAYVAGNYNTGVQLASFTSATERRAACSPVYISQRYFRIRFTTGAACDANVKIFGVPGFEKRI